MDSWMQGWARNGLCGFQPGLGYILGWHRHRGLLSDGGPATASTFGWIDPMLPVDTIKVLSLRVVRLKIVITHRPGARDSAVVFDFSEVLWAEAQ
jgi:hypothetical protein